MAIIKLKYQYYVAKPFGPETRREGKFDFDTSIFRDHEDNYYNVVSDYVDSLVDNPLMLKVEKQSSYPVGSTVPQSEDQEDRYFDPK